MKRILMAGFALALITGPALAQTAAGGQSSTGSNRGSEQPTTAPNAQSNNGSTTMQSTATGTAKMASSMNESQARAKLEADGYSSISGLMVGPDGMWHAKAMKGSQQTMISLDGKGNVVTR